MGKYKKYLIIIIALGILLIISIFLTCNKRDVLTIGKPKLISANDNVTSPMLKVGTNEILYFDTSNKTFKKIDLRTDNRSSVNKQVFQNVNKVYWSSDSLQTIISTALQGSDETYLIDNIYYNFSELKTVNKANLQNLVFSPDNNKIAFTELSESNPDNFIIKMSDPNGENIQELGQVATYGAPTSLFWVNQGEIEVIKPSYIPPESYDLTSEQTQGIIYRINPINSKITQDKNFSNLSDAIISPDNKYMVYSKVDDDGAFIYFEGKEHALDITFDSLASASWGQDGQSLYGIQSSTDLASTAPLSLYKVSLSDYSINKIFDFSIYKNTSGESYFLDNLMINSSEDTLYFTRKNKLYGLKIK